MRLLTLFLVLFASLSALGQATSKPILVDEFSRLSCCCEVGARMDNFILQLEASPTSIGYIVISNPKSSYVQWRERYFDGYLRMRGLEDRVRIERSAEDADPMLTRFWIVPAGANFESTFLGVESFQLRTIARRTLFFNSDSQLCSSVVPVDTLGKYLVANDDVKANIAIGSESLAAYKTEMKKITVRLESKHRVSSNRVRFFKMKGGFDGLYYEIWLVRTK